MAVKSLLRTMGAVACAMLILSAPARSEDLQTEPAPLAVADFDYVDTSGEVRDQQAEHEARLQAFARMIRDDLAHSGKYRIVALACRQDSCSGARSDPAELIEEARRAGARFLLYGGIKKLSTLVQNAKVQVIDIEADRLVFDRLLSFRGDTDEAWRRAERFLVRDLVSAEFSR